MPSEIKIFTRMIMVINSEMSVEKRTSKDWRKLIKREKVYLESCGVANWRIHEVRIMAVGLLGQMSDNLRRCTQKI